MTPPEEQSDAPGRPRPNAARIRAAIAGVIFFGYVAIAQTVLHFYPFSIFDMYARHANSGSRVVGRLDDGRLVEVRRYVGWSCDKPIDVRPELCREPADYYYVPYKDRESADWIAAHRGGPGGSVQLDVVRRIWWFDTPSSAPRPEDCPIARCQASPP